MNITIKNEMKIKHFLVITYCRKEDGVKNFDNINFDYTL